MTGMNISYKRIYIYVKSPSTPLNFINFIMIAGLENEIYY